MEDLKSIKHELQNLINGTGQQSESALIHAAKAYLTNNSTTGNKAEDAIERRAEEERALIDYAQKNNLLIEKEDLGIFIAEGAEQKVFFLEGNSFLFKASDAIFYTSWTDYLNNLLLHNYFFPDTSYTLAGFVLEENKLFAVVKQQFVANTEVTDLVRLKEYLVENGFVHKKNNDYYHPYLGIILEDLHDENVLTNSGILFFIDTVFYITGRFYEEI